MTAAETRKAARMARNAKLIARAAAEDKAARENGGYTFTDADRAVMAADDRRLARARR